MHRRLLRLVVVALACAAPVQAPTSESAFNPSPRAIEIPPWFQETFLDLREDMRAAAKEQKRLMLYFGQDGCPYCRALMRANFTDKSIADKTRERFHALAINIWGDREVTWLDGTVRTEKTFASFLRIQFTPTLLFLDAQGTVVLRLNGYYPPHQFDAALDYASGGHATVASFAEFLRRHAREAASGRLHPQPFLLKPPLDLTRGRAAPAKPLAVLFEQKQCAACDELHATGFKDPATLALIDRFDVARLELFGEQPLVTPSGKRTTETAWGRELNVAYTPTIVFFDARGTEVFRIEAYLRAFHLASSFDYVASGAYRGEPSFQRYLQRRAERIRAGGGRVDLW